MADLVWIILKIWINVYTKVKHCKLVYTDDTIQKDMDELLTVVQIAETLKVSKMTVYRYIKAGKLVAIKAGRDFRVRQSDFDNFLKKYKHK